jgi:hypothetical protein
MFLANLKHVLTNLSASKSKLLLIKPQFLTNQLHTSHRLPSSSKESPTPKEILNSSLAETKETSSQQISTHVSLGAKGWLNLKINDLKQKINPIVPFQSQGKGQRRQLFQRHTSWPWNRFVCLVLSVERVGIA